MGDRRMSMATRNQSTIRLARLHLNIGIRILISDGGTGGPGGPMALHPMFGRSVDS